MWDTGVKPGSVHISSWVREQGSVLLEDILAPLLIPLKKKNKMTGFLQEADCLSQFQSKKYVISALQSILEMVCQCSLPPFGTLTLGAGALDCLWGGGSTHSTLLWTKVQGVTPFNYQTTGDAGLQTVPGKLVGCSLCSVLKIFLVPEWIRPPAYEFHCPSLMLSFPTWSLKHWPIS